MQGIVGCCGKQNYTTCKQQHINQPGNNYPFPHAVAPDELMGFEIAVNGYDDFFKQDKVFMSTSKNGSNITILLCNMNLKPLPAVFYTRPDVLEITRDLLGKLIVTRFEGCITSARIVEAEAYNGVDDRASHAYGRRFTQRTKVMYAAGGHAYVYLCYGIHQMFNVVAGEAGHPLAILIRGGEPVGGIETMLMRRHMKTLTPAITNGPGKIAAALGLHTRHTGMSLQSPELFIADDGYTVDHSAVMATPRIGVDYAGEDALLPYRYIIKDNPFAGKFRF